MRRVALLLWMLAVLTPAHAQFGSLMFQGVGTTYQGPLDVVAGATQCFSLLGCSKAYNGPAVNVVNLSAAVTTLNILSNGKLDIATATTARGVDATATCSTSGLSTTLACTGASSTPNSGDEVFGTGITGPAFLNGACGTFTGGAGNCTLNEAQTIASTTVTFKGALAVSAWYDQTALKNCSGSTTCNLLQATGANRPWLLTNCLNGGTLPCIAYPPTSTVLIFSASFTPASGVVSFSIVAKRPISGTAGVLIRENAANNRLSSAASANTWTLAGGTSGTVNATVADSGPHAVVGVINGASSCVYVDGGSCTSGTATGNTTAGAITVGGTATILYLGMIIIYDGAALSSGQSTSLHTLLSPQWGTP